MPAEIISHLTVRTESVRSGFSYAAQMLIAKAMGIFSDEENVRDVLGLNGDGPSDLLRRQIAKLIEENPLLRQSGLPPAALERVLFGFLKENFSRMFESQRPFVGGALAGFYHRAGDIIRDGHKKSLSNELVPDIRVESLSRMQWTMLDVAEPLVLPDCVAIGIDSKGNSAPYLFQDSDDLIVVAMPLGTRRLMVGKVDHAHPFQAFLFNIRAVACSESFFVSSMNAKALADWSKYIGVESRTLIHRNVDGVFAEYIAKKATLQSPHEKKISAEPAGPAISSPQWMIHFLGCADEPTAKKIGETVSGVVAELAQVIPLNRIDGITFAQDYPAALRNLDRGFGSTRPLTTTDEEGVVGVAMSPLVLRDGVVKAHIVMRGDLGHALIGEDEYWRSIGYQMLVYELAEVSCTEIFDTALPGVLLKPITNYFDAYRFECLNFAWSSYFSARMSAGLARDGGKILSDVTIAALDRAGRDIPELRYAYRFDGDVPKLMNGTLKYIRAILSHAARLVGHFDSLSASPFDEEGALQGALDRRGLRQWFDTYQADLRKLWDRLGQWESFDEFLALGGHAERIMWQFGMVLWQSEDGVCRVEVPLASDIQRLVVHAQVAHIPRDESPSS
jgi:hypothetical protein